uniref:Uncharacterized protein n=1 Tax=Zea mays TaxID=4577 RepID=C4J0N2_MAIZE|nr:unknown [Zea mays]
MSRKGTIRQHNKRTQNQLTDTGLFHITCTLHHSFTQQMDAERQNSLRYLRLG